MRKNQTKARLAKVICSGLLLSMLTVIMPLKSHAISNQGVATLMNQERSSAGLRSLAWNASLGSSALLKAQHMCVNNYWTHTAPDGTTPWTFIKKAGYPYSTAAENLARGYSSDSAVVSAWMASTGHRANILNGTFADVGVASMACTILGEYKTVTVAHFGATSSGASKPQPTTKAQTKTVTKPASPSKVTASLPVLAAVPAQPAPSPPKLNPYEKVRGIVWRMYKNNFPRTWQLFKRLGIAQ